MTVRIDALPAGTIEAGTNVVGYTGSTTERYSGIATAEALNDLVETLAVVGSGATRVLRVAKKDGTIVNLAIPQTAAAPPDSNTHLQSAAVSGTDLVLTLNDSSTVTVSLSSFTTDNELFATIAALRQVPPISSGDANKVLKVNAAGNAADWEDDEGGLTQA